MGAKRAKIALIVVLFGAAGYLAFAYLTRPGPIADSLQLVCASSGETFWLSREKVVEIPMPHPKTGEKSLFTCSKDESGALHVSDRYRSLIEGLGEKNRAIDLETMRVKAPG